MRELGEGSVKTFAQNNPSGAIVLLTARWCGSPCDALVPVLELIEAENPSVSFAVANLDNNRELAAQLAVTGVPTILGFIDSKCVSRCTFNHDKLSIEADMSKVLTNVVS